MSQLDAAPHRNPPSAEIQTVGNSVILRKERGDIDRWDALQRSGTDERDARS